MGVDTSWSAVCDAGCRLMAESQFSHHPPNPGWGKEDYEFAKRGPASSNIYSGQGMVSQVDSYMDDSDKSNRDRVGHRRWCLNPKMLNTTFSATAGKSMMWSMNRSRKEVPDYDFVSFPANGMTPVSFINSGYVWHVSVNERKYGKPGENVRVKVWLAKVSLAKDRVLKATEPLALEYFNVDNGRYGIPNAIIFKPRDARVTPGASYLVEVFGLRGGSETEPSLSYLVIFIR